VQTRRVNLRPDGGELNFQIQPSHRHEGQGSGRPGAWFAAGSRPGYVGEAAKAESPITAATSGSRAPVSTASVPPIG